MPSILPFASSQNLKKLSDMDIFGLIIAQGAAQQLSLPHDPLHTGALKKTKRDAIVELGMCDRPKLCCRVTSTNFGFALSGSGHYIILSRANRPILQTLDGTTTVESILHKFGPASLELIGGLFQQHLLELQ